jgi:hypothetical protein
MSRKIAGLLFLVVCVVLALLLLIGAITPMVSGIVFAISLATLGAASGGFRKA